MMEKAIGKAKMSQRSFYLKLLDRAITFVAKIGLLDLLLALIAHIRYALKHKRVRHSLDAQVIVSLTSYPPRYRTLSLTLKTLLSQSLKPDLVVLWIYESDMDKLPASVKSLVGQDFVIRATKSDTGSYKKLLNSLVSYPSAYIVSADDDVYYTRNWLSRLVKEVRIGAREIIGHRGHRITLTQRKTIRPYSEWEWRVGAALSKTSDRVVLTGCAGILYPPNSLSDKVLDEEVFLELCPTSDDLWFYFMARLNDYTCRVVPGRYQLYSWKGSQDTALVHENYDGGNNDIAIEKLVAEYGLPFEDHS